jgi:cysteine-rich repeat protein
MVLAMGLSLLGDEAAAFTAPRAGSTVLHRRDMAQGPPVRPQRDLTRTAPARAQRAHAALANQLGAVDTLWDRDTGVPLRIWGAGLDMPGSVQSGAVAARHARELLAQHLDLLAPGSRIEDFELVGDDLHAGVRSLGFAQRFAGRPVLGGQLSFRFKHGRLIAVASEALPDVRAALAPAVISDDLARARATAWILADLAATATATAVDGPFILPILVSGQRPRYREVVRVTVDAQSPLGRYAVFLDSATGDPVARDPLLHFASGTVAFRVPQRGPQGNRVDLPAPRLGVFVNGLGTTTDAAGQVTFADGQNAAVIAGVQGDLVALLNDSGPVATTDLSLPPGGIALWTDPGEQTEAQLSAYIHANVVKSRVRSIDPTFAYLDQQLQVTVNIQDICNAFSDGDSINFFLSGEGCENTALLADVVYHEFGHSVHQQGLIPGVGQFEGALSEGIADYLSATITNDAGLARGFFVAEPDEPLRQLDPVGDEWHWPDDLTGEVHDDGRIIGGTLWDLRTALITKLGPAAGIARTDHIWFQSIRRAVDIPTMYPEALVADDDDGNLANGTPNECEINLAFQAHGLLGAGGVSGTVTQGAPAPNGTPVRLDLLAGAKACVDLSPVGARVIMRRAGVPGNDKTLDMTPDPGGFSAVMPNADDGTLGEYHIEVLFNDQSVVSFPQNAADPWYQIYFGPVTPLFCSSFETPQDLAGWQLQGQWQQGAPQGLGGDPAAAFSGQGVLGVNLAGAYAPTSSSTLTSPPIATQGFPVVRLQYRRWLGVEDGIFDAATIVANNQTVWQNAFGDGGSTSLNHRDGEWRFHDVLLTDAVANDQVQLQFTLQTDEFLELAGWNIDEFCVVGTDESPLPVGVCGDGVLDVGELCDNASNNSDVLPGACRTNCQPARCGDLVVDPGELCDDGNLSPGDGCDANCLPEGPINTTEVPTEGGVSGDDSSSSSSGPGLDGDLTDRGCACDQRGGSPLGHAALAGLLLLGLRRRRR